MVGTIPINQSSNRTNQSINQTINQSIESINRPTNQSINQSITNQWAVSQLYRMEILPALHSTARPPEILSPHECLLPFPGTDSWYWDPTCACKSRHRPPWDTLPWPPNRPADGPCTCRGSNWPVDSPPIESGISPDARYDAPAVSPRWRLGRHFYRHSWPAWDRCPRPPGRPWKCPALLSCPFHSLQCVPTLWTTALNIGKKKYGEFIRITQSINQSINQSMD